MADLHPYAWEISWPNENSLTGREVTHAGHNAVADYRASVHPDATSRAMVYYDEAIAEIERLQAEIDRLSADAARLNYIERTFSGMTNRERYLPVAMIWGKGCNGRTLREACDKYMARDAKLAADGK